DLDFLENGGRNIDHWHHYFCLVLRSDFRREVGISFLFSTELVLLISEFDPLTALDSVNDFNAIRIAFVCQNKKMKSFLLYGKTLLVSKSKFSTHRQK